MTRILFMALLTSAAITTQAQAFCGDFELGTAPGFGSDSWAEKFAILGVIVAAVLSMPTLAAFAIVKNRKDTKGAEPDLREMEAV